MMTPDRLLKNRVPPDYAEALVLHRETAKRLLDRAQWMTLQPKVIIDMGGDLGESALLWLKRYETAQMIWLDPAFDMLQYAKKLSKTQAMNSLCVEPFYLPIKQHAADVCVANLFLPWCLKPSQMLDEWHRIVKPNGLFMLTTLGPATLQELQNEPLDFPHFWDMHHVGDALMQAR